MPQLRSSPIGPHHMLRSRIWTFWWKKLFVKLHFHRKNLYPPLFFTSPKVLQTLHLFLLNVIIFNDAQSKVKTSHKKSSLWKLILSRRNFIDWRLSLWDTTQSRFPAKKSSWRKCSEFYIITVHGFLANGLYLFAYIYAIYHRDQSELTLVRAFLPLRTVDFIILTT